MIRARHSLLFVLSLLCAGPALAQQAPEVLPYQGYLTDANGNPVDGNVAMTFRMYETSDAGQPSWTETWNNVPVEDGMFVVYLGQFTSITDGVLNTTTKYLGIEVGNDGEAQPRQRVGAVAYSIYARDAYYFRGYGPDYFVTDEELANYNYVDADEVRVLIAEEGGGGEIDLDGYVTDEELAAALAGLGDTYVTIEDIDARNYVNEGDLENYVTNNQLDARLENYIDGDELAAAIANFITEADLVAYLENNNYVQDADLDALRDRISANEDAIAANRVDIDANRADIDANEAAIDALRDRVDALEAQIAGIADAGQPYVLGRSAQTSNGRFTFGGVNGIKAAHAMCVASFPNDPTAHFCSTNEVQQAMAAGRYSADNAAAFDNVATWTVSQVSAGDRGNNGLFQTCQNLMYNSADNSSGVRLTVDIDYQSAGNGGGVTGDIVRIEQQIGCGQNMPVLCCR